MKKSDLKSGMILEFENKEQRLVMLGTKIGDITCQYQNPKKFYGNIVRPHDYYELDKIEEDLTSSRILGNVNKVYGMYGELIWERKEEFKIEVGKWYKTLKHIFHVVENDDLKYCTIYGFILDGEHKGWFKNGSFNASKSAPCPVLREATTEEVETALKIEAKKRGFNDKTVVKMRVGANANIKNLSGITGGIGDYNESKNALDSKRANGYIFWQGQWAEIVEKEEDTREVGEWYESAGYVIKYIGDNMALCYDKDDEEPQQFEAYHSEDVHKKGYRKISKDRVIEYLTT